MNNAKPMIQDHDDFFLQLDRWGTFILANLLFVLLCLPLVTLPLAVAGLFAVMSNVARGNRPEVFRTFLEAIRTLWQKALVVILIDLVIGLFIAVNLSIFPQMSIADPLAYVSGGVMLFVILAAGIVNLYVWSLMVITDLPVKQLIQFAYQMAFAAPIWSIGILIATFIPVVISLLLPQAFFILFTFSCIAFIASAGTWRVIRRYSKETTL